MTLKLKMRGSPADFNEEEARYDQAQSSPLNPAQQRKLAAENIARLKAQKAAGTIRPIEPEPAGFRAQKRAVRAPHPYANSAKGASLLDLSGSHPAETPSTISLPAKTKRIL